VGRRKENAGETLYSEMTEWRNWNSVCSRQFAAERTNIKTTNGRNWLLMVSSQRRPENERQTNMKALNIALATGLLALGSFSTHAPADKPDKVHPIVGLWDVYYTSDYAGPLFHTHDQWHSDGLEFEVNSVANGAMCQGTWVRTSERSVKRNHVGFVFDSSGALVGPFQELQQDNVSRDGKTYNGTYDTKYYDTNGNLLQEDTGTVQATRITVN
jgi:hypothetical protein